MMGGVKKRMKLVLNMLYHRQNPMEQESCSDVPEESTEMPTFCTKATTTREQMSVFTVNLQ